MEEIRRGEIWWADLPEPRRSEPGLPSLRYRRPGDSFNRSRIQTLIVTVITGNVDLADAPGNVLLRADALPRDSVVNVSQLPTLDRGFLTGHVGTLSPRSQNPSTGDCARCSSWRRKRGLGLFNVPTSDYTSR